MDDNDRPPTPPMLLGAVCVLFTLLFNGPLLGIPLARGPITSFGYLFVGWGVMIALVAGLSRRLGKGS